MKKLDQELASKVDGQLFLDFQGNLSLKPREEEKSGIDGSGTYVLRNGKLVKGEGEKREKAQFSNWYCSNADPEDIRKHRELMDRMNYKGPQWDDIGRPKSILEEENPVYKKVDPETHPMVNQ